MFDFAWSELALIAVVALIVIGPKDLPRAWHTLGVGGRKARAIAREFQGSIEDLVREAELDEVKRHVDEATRFNLEEEFTKTVDPQGELQRSLAEPVLANPMADAPLPIEPPREPPPDAAPPQVVTAPTPSEAQHAEPPALSGGSA
jgi:sec-independent protein translocase protein TatB